MKYFIAFLIVINHGILGSFLEANNIIEQPAFFASYGFFFGMICMAVLNIRKE